MRVLYVNHTGLVAGGERSLLELLAGLPEEVEPMLACPPGELAAEARQLDVAVAAIPPAAPSFRLDPARTAKGIAGLARAAVAVTRLVRRSRPDVVHANSVRAGLACVPAGRITGAPVVVHVRDCLPAGTAADLTRGAIGLGARLVIANSAYTAATLARSGFRPAVRVVHNGVDLATFDPERVDRAEARGRLGLEPGDAALGVVAQITPWKAQDDAIRIVSALRRGGVQARLLVVGGPVFAEGGESFDNVAFERSLHELARGLGIADALSFLGPRDDVPTILSALDLLLAPSWEEPFGRSIVEAMAMGVPVIATSVGGTTEIITEGAEGLLRPPRAPDRWAEAAAYLLGRRELREQMGLAGRRTVAARFTRELHVQGVLDAYREVIPLRSFPA